VPDHLSIVVRVDVDESGRDDLARGIDLLPPFRNRPANLRDDAVQDADVCDAALAAQPVVHRSISNDHVHVAKHIEQSAWRPAMSALWAHKKKVCLEPWVS